MKRKGRKVKKIDENGNVSTVFIWIYYCVIVTNEDTES